MEIEVIEKAENRLRFIIRGSNDTYINALRRTIISEVPVLAIEDIILVENSSPFLDEIIAHRLGLIPLTTVPDEFTIASECEECGGEGCHSCSVDLSLDVEASLDAPRVVYSGDLSSPDEAIKPVSDKIPIAQLAPGQKITLEAIALFDRGKRHAKWSPVVTCSYRYYPEVDQDKDKCTGCGECIEACPKNLLELKKKEVILTDPYECLLCDLCESACDYDSLKMKGIPGEYIFFLESTGAFPPLYIIKKATEILKSKAEEFEAEYKKSLDEYLKKK
ncbi:MAG: DNA-directed RNA polymerase subunit D [Candidatus Heimdallarchaeota archaeon]|nr:DNA-directed RNA polymerase subunit D [Candidatus Heimdallarchaeota archaeon]